MMAASIDTKLLRIKNMPTYTTCEWLADLLLILGFHGVVSTHILEFDTEPVWFVLFATSADAARARISFGSAYEQVVVDAQRAKRGGVDDPSSDQQDKAKRRRCS